MFRRVELIEQIDVGAYEALIRAIQRDTGEPEAEIRHSFPRYWKSGLMGVTHEAVVNAWIDINGPRRGINRYSRFFFTEEGWRRFGRPTIAACQGTGQKYRVISIKERSVDVIYRDEFQVAVRPKKRKADSRDRGIE